MLRTAPRARPRVAFAPAPASISAPTQRARRVCARTPTASASVPPPGKAARPPAPGPSSDADLSANGIPPAPKPSAPPSDRSTRHYERVTWPAVDQMARTLIASLSTTPYDVVLAVTRGGLVPAALVCEGLGVRNVLSATVIFYTDSGDQFYGLRVPRFLAFPSESLLAGRRVLVVDDVWDSGRTASAVRERVRRADPECVHVAVMHYKPGASAVEGTPDFFAEKTESWIVFPWEELSPHSPKVGRGEEA